MYKRPSGSCHSASPQVTQREAGGSYQLLLALDLVGGLLLQLLLGAQSGQAVSLQAPGLFLGPLPLLLQLQGSLDLVGEL